MLSNTKTSFTYLVADKR